MKTTVIYLVVACGGAAGAVARLFIANATRRLLGNEFPCGTLVVNLSGSFLLGLLVGMLMARTLGNAELLRYGLGVGFLGAYTTFSTFTLEGSDLVSTGKIGMALVYLVGSVVAGLAAVKMGLMLGRF